MRGKAECYVLTWQQAGRSWSREFVTAEASDEFQAELERHGLSVTWNVRWRPSGVRTPAS